MREILFRGKRIDNGEWVEGGIVQGVVHELWRNSDRAYITVFPEFLSKVKLEEVDPTTVGQYIGLPDKNGKKIFEGDILRFPPGTYHPVFYDADYCGFGSCYFNDFDSLYKYNFKNIEVAGNIHDNPELLEVDK